MEFVSTFSNKYISLLDYKITSFHKTSVLLCIKGILRQKIKKKMNETFWIQTLDISQQKKIYIVREES